MEHKSAWQNRELFLAYAFVLVAIAMRFIPHPLAFTPVGAALLYFGARAPRKHILFPVAALALSDIVLTTRLYGYPLTADHLVTWAWYAVALAIGGMLTQNPKPSRIAAASIFSSSVFFVVSNFAVWEAWSMYPKTLAGLFQAYLAGLPFFRHELFAGLVFSAVVFGAGALLTSRESRGRERTAQV